MSEPRGDGGTERTPQGSVHEHDCVVCGTLVRYVDFCPHIVLCLDCGYPDPAPCVEADEDGYAYIVTNDMTKDDTDNTEDNR
ncbi:small CPxCG-related zinc finger protein [Natronomonas pharaonis DSM 2160]|uniref:Small CPxCG-related zinc finger protein n=1 Tax=Natronomonas pharaonis (strain ATCC 35678 / DSM 2160 / CIP 103997 / JCM 8858 / NBRC 14720 / NCIMB 2260 / Gabara) TaxID=348780 RepID=A0A1U7EW00_NATPD|nr:hypothetical protein [Natronomonas pharaonis]CAI49257.1 small CPxCG-related zinc finger protein [Natronomonas pharaonis DSM 2160]